MKAAVMDLGTNTFHLMAVEQVAGSKLQVLCKNQYVVKLGQGGINDGIISPAAFERGLIAIAAMAHTCTMLGVHMSEVSAFATSGIRSAGNGGLFISQVLAHTGIAINIISGEQEAQYIFQGVKQTIQPEGNYLVMDIGGGSVEFIIANGDSVLWKNSFLLGAARLRERFHTCEPIAQGQVEAMHHHLAETLFPLAQALALHPCNTLVGAAGSFETLLKLCGRSFETNLCARLQAHELTQIHQRLLTSTMQSRSIMPGIVSYRAEMIVVASVLVQYVVNLAGVSAIFASLYSLKEGVLAERLMLPGDSKN